MRLLVTGASGFVGGHLLEQVKDIRPSPELFAWGVPGSFGKSANVVWSEIDIRSPEAVRSAVASAAPTHVCHLAAASNVASSFRDQRRTWEVNLMGSLNLLQALAEVVPESTILLVSSSEVYGESFASGEPLDEDARLRPMNPYAASKASCELMARTFGHHGPRVIIARPFNHIGPGQSEGFSVASFARQLARIGAGLQAPSLSVGNLEARRDFLDVEDVVRGYISALTRAEPLDSGSIINISSGVARRIGDVLDMLIARSGLEVEVTQDPSRMRPSDISTASGRADRARVLLGWEPQVPFDATLDRVLADWRERVTVGLGEGL